MENQSECKYNALMVCAASRSRFTELNETWSSIREKKPLKMSLFSCWKGLADMGFKNVAPSNGTFYIYADTSELVRESPP